MWRRLVSGAGQSVLAGLFASIVSGTRKPVPGAGIGNDVSGGASTSQTEHRVLARPLDGCIAQSGDADAAWQSTFDRGLHKSGRKEGERYRHIDLAHAAPLAITLGGSSAISSEAMAGGRKTIPIR